MPPTPDIRWHQRFQSFCLALNRLSAAVNLARQRPLSELEQQGLIQAFEFTHELAWNVLKDYLQSQGFVNLVGSRDACREAYKSGLIEKGEVWMDMIQSRNRSSHTYNEETAREISAAFLEDYTPCFLALRETFVALSARES